MSDDFGGGENPKIKFVIDTTDSKQAIIDMTALGNSVKKSMSEADASVKLVYRSLQVMIANARTNLEQMRAATAKAQADAKVRVAKADTNKSVAILQARADSKAAIALSDQATAKIEGNQRRLTKTNEANQRIRVANNNQANKIILQGNSIVHQQQMQAAKSTTAAHTANAKVAVATQKTIQNSIIATGKVQTAIINSNSKAAQAAAAQAISLQNHQQRIAVAALQQQNRMALAQQRQAGGGGGRGGGGGGGGGGWGAAWGTSGLLQGAGTVGKALACSGAAGLLGGFVGLAAAGFVAGAIVGQITAIVKSMVDAAGAADAMTAAYARQAVAARTLAGSQSQVNRFLTEYDEATGGVLGKQKQLEGVTKLLSVGFADTSDELQKAAKGIRGISLATGRDPDAVQNDLILEMFTQRGQRLDQLGLQYDVVREKQEEMMDANSSLTKQQAYQNAVLEHAEERYGALADSAAGQATATEKLAADYEDLGLAIAQAFKVPIDNIAAFLNKDVNKIQAAADAINRVTPNEIRRTGDVPGGIWEGQKGSHNLAEAQAIKIGLEMEKASLEAGNFNSAVLGTVPTAEQLADAFAKVNGELLKAGRSVAALNAQHMLDTGGLSPTMGLSNDPYAMAGKAKGPTADQIDEMVSFTTERNAIMAQANSDALAENRSYFQSRNNLERDYQQNLTEEAADFARQRARDNAHFAADLADAERDMAKDRLDVQEDLAKSIARANRDHNRQLAKYQEDLEENIADSRKDAAERTEEAIEDFNEKQAEAREDSGKQILEMEEDFKRQQKRAAEDHNDAILDAASHLDAAAVYAEQKSYARKKRQAEEDQALAIAKEKEKLTEELAENAEAHAETLSEIKENLADEIEEQNKAHQERVKDANEAHALQLADQQAAAAERLHEQDLEDAERLQDMKDAHILRQSEEDIDRGIRLGKDATQHNAQLLEMDRVHGERLTQIGTHAGQELTELETAHKARMLEMGYENQEWTMAEKRAQAIALAEHKKFLLEDRKLSAEQRAADIKAKMAEAIAIGADLGPLQDALNAVNATVLGLTGEISDQQTVIDALPKPQDAKVERNVLTGSTITEPIIKAEGSSYTITPSSMTGGAVSKTSNIRVDQGAIVIHAPPGMSTASLGTEFETRLLQVLRKVAQVG